MSAEDIEALVESYEKQCNQIKEDAMRLAWYMRGSLSYDEALMLCADERDIVNKIVKDNFETVKKTGLPFF